MLDPDPPFEALEYPGGYVPIEDHGLIGDGSTAALVARDGTVDWLCVPRFDGDPLFASILDREEGGAFVLRPEGLQAARQWYVEDSGVLVTEMRTSSGTAEVRDALTLRSGADLAEDVPADRGELVRCVRVLDGTVRLRVDVAPRGGVEPAAIGGGYALHCPSRPQLNLQLHASPGLDAPRTTVELEAGDTLDLSIRWGHLPLRHHPHPPRRLLERTVDVWRQWARCIHYEGPQTAMIRRSAITLKLLDHVENGAIVAAPTSSLPETIGGSRNWDYRYAWVRDCAFSVYALRRIGMSTEAWAFLAWVLDCAERHGGPRVVYDLDGAVCPKEEEDESFAGYRGSRPVRWGNGAAYQQQNDVHGEIVDCAYQWGRAGGTVDPNLWKRLRSNVEAASRLWNEPDHGIWEVRTPGRLFTYSVALCHVALDRGAKLARDFDLPGDAAGWRRQAETLRETILREAWDEERGALIEHVGEAGGLDASVLALPLRRVVSAQHPRMVATCRAVAEELDAGDGLLYRYRPEVSPDGFDEEEGAFLLVSFWLVDNLALQGRLEEAHDLYERLCSRANTLGLLSEQLDPGSGRFLGNFPQAFSHVGVISSGITLARAEREDSAGSPPPSSPEA